MKQMQLVCQRTAVAQIHLISWKNPSYPSLYLPSGCIKNRAWILLPQIKWWGKTALWPRSIEWRGDERWLGASITHRWGGERQRRGNHRYLEPHFCTAIPKHHQQISRSSSFVRCPSVTFLDPRAGYLLLPLSLSLSITYRLYRTCTPLENSCCSSPSHHHHLLIVVRTWSGIEESSNLNSWKPTPRRSSVLLLRLKNPPTRRADEEDGD